MERGRWTSPTFSWSVLACRYKMSVDVCMCVCGVCVQVLKESGVDPMQALVPCHALPGQTLSCTHNVTSHLCMSLGCPAERLLLYDL